MGNELLRGLTLALAFITEKAEFFSRALIAYSNKTYGRILFKW